MELMNEMSRAKQQGAWQSAAWDEAVDIYLKMLAPLAPHISEELWERLGKPYSIHQQTWPVLDEAATVQEEMTLAVQINGKVRDHITVAVDTGAEEVKACALSTENTQKFLNGKPPRQVIYVAGRLVNIVV
jgi:leucyl-tRNA synthetase